MLKQERISLMDEYIRQKGFASMDELCKKFSVSINTVRVDLKSIIATGHAKRTYGGVTYVPPERPALRAEGVQAATFGSYESRLGSRAAEKQAIARLAAEAIRDGDIIYIDVGTTCLPILDNIPADYNVTVITNDLSAINKTMQHSNLKLMTFGGVYQRRTNYFKCTFPALHSYLEACNISKAFFGVTGVSPAGMMTNSENFGRELRASLIKTCPECYLLADATKFGKVALLTYGLLTDLTACISDESLTEEYRELCRALGVELRLAKVQKNEELF